MNRHSRSANHRWLLMRLGGAALTAAAILGTTALVNTRRARLAERKNPPAGQFLDIEGVHLHYLERGEGPPLVLLHGNGAMAQDSRLAGYSNSWPNDIASLPSIARASVTQTGHNLRVGHLPLRLNSCTRRSRI
jgi:hypothetical protein